MMTNESAECLLNVAVVSSVGLQASEDSLVLISNGGTGDRPGPHLLSIKRAERPLHHCNCDLLSVYMVALVLTYVSPMWVDLSDKCLLMHMYVCVLACGV